MMFRGRSLLVPEVLQTSLMDCGPAALNAVLAGFGLPASYDFLRERCATDVDGTSIDALAVLARELGLDTYQLLVPPDSLLLPEARCLPAIVVTRGAGGLLHFIVVWRAWGPWVQVMDPSGGRRWVGKRRFLESVPIHAIPLSADRWRRWSSSEDALRPMRWKARRCGLSSSQVECLVELAEHDASFRTYAALDAATRMVSELVASGALPRGRVAADVLVQAFEGERRVDASEDERQRTVPPRFWWARNDSGHPDRLTLHGCVVVHFAARVGRNESELKRAARASTMAQAARGEAEDRTPRDTCLSQAWMESSLDGRQRPMLALWQLVRSHARGALWWLALAVLASAAIGPCEALLLRSLLHFGERLGLAYQRVVAVTSVVVLMAVVIWLERWTLDFVRELGRLVEVRLRIGLFERLPRLDDKYLRTRPVSDLANRGHSVHALREIPALWVQSLRACLSLSASGFGLICLYPTGALLIAALASLPIAFTFVARRSLSETSLRLRTHAGALERFYLDALMGAVPIRVHGGERAIRNEHEALLTEWIRAGRSFHGQSTFVQSLQSVSSGLGAVMLSYAYWRDGGEIATLLLFAFWALQIPAAGAELAAAQLTLRSLRGAVLRMLAPLTATVQFENSLVSGSRLALAASGGVNLSLRRVSMLAGGQPLLREIELDVRAGCHVAIVGASGAGKSSLLALLLGFSSPSRGSVQIDGEGLTAALLPRLREITTWIDPTIRLWDQSLYQNLAYASEQDAHMDLSHVLESADLMEVLERLPAGMRQRLGEGGVGISGGQGQRVRLGRALMRKHARLVLLDEPFRGLEREQRAMLLRRTRARFTGATLLCVTHDIADTLSFARVIVMDQGRIIEDGAPLELLSCEDGAYARALRAERLLYEQLWGGSTWRRLRVSSGRAVELRP